ncbi:MAG: P22 coat protein - protein 5 domain protein [Actinobacteria bacterium]|nr:P22 coat protein - protein 5 domain protein [Actinomycetota bacterium]
MTINNFNPTLWAKALLMNLNDAHVYVQGANRDYEGEIRQAGDAVKINSIGRVTIGNYVKNVDIGSPETLDDSQMTMLIDQQKFFNFQIDDIDKAQQVPKIMNEAMREAAWGLADSADVFMATMLDANVDAANILSAATAVGTDAGNDDAYEILVDLDTRLTTNNVPPQGRWVVVPPWFEGVLRKDPRFVSFGTSQNRRNLAGEPLRRISNLDVMVSNNVPVDGAASVIIAGYPGAVTYADQIPPGDTEAYRPEQRFGDAMKGLHVYGGKVTRPHGLAKIDATPA